MPSVVWRDGQPALISNQALLLETDRRLFTAPPDTEALRKELERVKGERDAMAQALAHIASFDPWEPAGPAAYCAKDALATIAAQGDSHG